MSRARYIVFEGGEGLGKTTQTEKLANYLISKGYNVLQTKEPGTSHLPVTMRLREIMLSNEFDQQITATSRELISQIIRNIHLEKLVFPALDKYDFIIQDRGILSGLSYGSACGHNIDSLEGFNEIAVFHADHGAAKELDDIYSLYDDVILFTGDTKAGLAKARAKKEFKEGDAMESQNDEFYRTIDSNFMEYGKWFEGLKVVNVTDKGIDQVFDIIKDKLNIE